MGSNRKPIRLAKEVIASAAGTLSRKIYVPCTLERIVVRFPPGSEGDLRLTPYIITPQGIKQVVYDVDDAVAADGYLSGDDYTHVFLVSLEVPVKSIIGVDYNNTDAINAHFFEVS